MKSKPYPLKLPHSIKRAAVRLAREDGVSLNQWIASAVAQKVGAVETAVEYLKRRAERADEDKFRDVLARIPDCAPDAEDALH